MSGRIFGKIEEILLIVTCHRWLGPGTPRRRGGAAVGRGNNRKALLGTSRQIPPQPSMERASPPSPQEQVGELVQHQVRLMLKFTMPPNALNTLPFTALGGTLRSQPRCRPSQCVPLSHHSLHLPPRARNSPEKLSRKTATS